MVTYVAIHSGEFLTGVAYVGEVKIEAEKSVAYYGGTVHVWEEGAEVRQYYTSTWTKEYSKGKRGV